MWVFYYQYNPNGKTYVVCVRGSFPSSKSHIWENANTSVWMVPGTHDEIDSEADQ